MVTTIQIDEKTKHLLDKLKVHYRHSYNEVIEKMAKENIGGKKDIMFFAGAWKDLEDKEVENIKKSISNLRKSSTKELIDRT